LAEAHIKHEKEELKSLHVSAVLDHAQAMFKDEKKYLAWPKIRSTFFETEQKKIIQKC
jgi:hypothetical protein